MVTHFMKRLSRLFRHLWLDASDSRRTIPDEMSTRLAQRVAASEARHTGEVRLCIEAALPVNEAWRIGASSPVSEVVRERALDWYGRLGIWDTEHNNGVLVYLLLAEHAIEIVADRALARRIDQARWQDMVNRLSARLREGAFEDGLTAALEEVSALLVEHFPAEPGHVRANELPDCVLRV